MNNKLIGFCGFITACLGIPLGLAVAEVSQNDFESRVYQNLHVKFAIAGAVCGAVVGAGQESVRQLKARRDQEWQDHG